MEESTIGESGTTKKEEEEEASLWFSLGCPAKNGISRTMSISTILFFGTHSFAILNFSTSANLAFDLVSELVKVGDEELKAKPVPLVFASFSGGHNACIYKVLQILERICETGLSQDDSVHPTTLKMPKSPKPFVWGIASSLDYVFLNRFESQRAEFWQTLYSTITMRVPYLILCSENDDLAPYQTIHNFATCLQELGGNVIIGITKSTTKQLYPTSCRKQRRFTCRRREAMKEETPCDDEISVEPTQQTFGGSGSTSGLNQSFNGTLLVTTDHFFVPSTVGYYVGNGGGSVQDEHKQDLIRLFSAQNEDKDGVRPNGVLGQILFDVYYSLYY
ncbi:hypothetical protein Bca4012_082225 [Brassica carinata]